MKNRFYACLLALALLLTACGTPAPMETTAGTEPPTTAQTTVPKTTQPPEPEVAMPGLDVQGKYIRMGFFNFQEAENFYCGTTQGMGHTLMYYDKESGTSGVLCADPSCTHTSRSCSASVDGVGSLAWYDGLLYSVAFDHNGSHDSVLYSNDLSGRKQREVKRISYDNVIMPYQPQDYYIHRGYLYFLGQSNVMEDGKAVQRYTLMSSPLDQDEDFTALYDESGESVFAPKVRFAGDSAYLLTLHAGQKGEGVDYTIIKYNRKSGTEEVVYRQAWTGENIYEFWPTPEGTIYATGLDDAKGICYFWKIQNGQREVVTAWENWDFPQISDGIAVNQYQEGKTQMIDVRNFEGETLYCGELFPEEIPGFEGNFGTARKPDPYSYRISFLGGDNEKLIFNLERYVEHREPGSQFSTSSDIAYCTVMLDMKENLKPTILWQAEQEETYPW